MFKGLHHLLGILPIKGKNIKIKQEEIGWWQYWLSNEKSCGKGYDGGQVKGLCR